MKSTVFLFTLSLFLLPSLFAGELPSAAEMEKLEFFKTKKIRITAIHEKEPFYLLETVRTKQGKKRPALFAVSKDLKYVYPRVIETSSGERVYLKKSPVPYRSSASFTYGSGPKEYFIFTDPECPFCRKLEAALAKKDLSKEVTIHYYLYPLPMHKNARAMSRYILAGKKKHERMQKVMLEGDRGYQAVAGSGKDSRLDTTVSAALELGISGTPTILTPAGERIFWKTFVEEMGRE